MDKIFIKWLARGIMKRWGNEEMRWGGDWKTWKVEFYFSCCVKILGDHYGSFGKLKNVVFYFDFGVVTNRRSCESEVCRFLSRGKIQRQFATQYTEGGRVSIL